MAGELYVGQKNAVKSIITLGGRLTIGITSVWSVCFMCLISIGEGAGRWLSDALEVVVVGLALPLGLFGSLGVMGGRWNPILDGTLIVMNFFLLGYGFSGIWRLVCFFREVFRLARGDTRTP
ncbi:hypothetical protein HW115_19470 [Verrucomicrobiaceae bacterium N1E253]|uniref:Uncharacterized protein n=1 Tax=Oceaniferula marina TaxID=2748318 RepID=A0A851GJ19_9BACT|nr:hypothetical protein [Oceaniferula marina]NWK57808.1 hypothetical protein [Oceaniferula marina]